MRNILFSCPACGQHLDAEAEWGGMEVPCPACEQAITIPPEADHSALHAMKSERDMIAIALQRARDSLAAAEREKQSLRAALGESGAALAVEEESFKNLLAKHESLQDEMAGLRRSSAERESRHEAVRGELQELAEESRRLTERLSGQERLAAGTREELNAALKNSETVVADWDETKLQLRQALAARDEAQRERNKLKADLSVRHELADFLALREKAAEMEIALNGVREKFGRVLVELRTARGEIHRLNDERVRLKLELAASRDAMAGSKLERDNAVLRSLVKRLNEELNQYRPLSRRAATKLAARLRAARGEKGIFPLSWLRRLAISPAEPIKHP